MHVRFSDAARSDISRIRDFIKPLNPVAARRVVDFIIATAYQLKNFPFLGRAGREEGTREVSIPKYP
ncbi:MAG: type II toxin-antitoxin system RelE/ParE family toxin [Cohaesibacteraceae bacterium]|nr:type II toxin-antitoxin system RelE/ParE family toxin [Cohaesibacteraceae bacterium]